jgi:hypothetical protein
MKLLPSQKWTIDLTCSECGCNYQADENDVEAKITDYYGGNVTSKPIAWAECPKCNFSLYKNKDNFSKLSQKQEFNSFKNRHPADIATRLPPHILKRALERFEDKLSDIKDISKLLLSYSNEKNAALKSLLEKRLSTSNDNLLLTE